MANENMRKLYSAARQSVPLPELWSSYGWSVVKKGDRFVSSTSPCCGEGTRDDAVSMSIYSDGWRWKCFKCGAGGSAIDAEALKHGISHLVAAKRLVEAGGGITRITGEVPCAPRPAKEKSEERTAAIRRVLDVITADGSSRDPVALAYLASRGISTASVNAAFASGLLRFLPGNPAAADAFLRLKLSHAEMVSSGILKPESKWPAAVYRPIVFLSQDRGGCEFRSAGKASGPKAIQFGRPTRPMAFIPEGAITHIYVCEGGVDLLSLIELGVARNSAIFGVYGTGSWRDGWIEEIAGTMPEAPWKVAFDNDDAGEKASDTLLAALAERGVPGQRYRPWGGSKDWNDTLIASKTVF